MSEKIIAIDPGKFRIKGATGTEAEPTLVDYRSKLYTLKPDEHFEPQGVSKFITYKDGRYIIGDQGSDTDKSFKKDTILHKVGMMAALSDMVSEGDIVRLVLGCPAAIYKDKTARSEYKEFMTDGGILSFETGEKHFDITIASTLPMPESSGAPYVYPSLFQGRRVGVIDMGGLNLNFSVFNNMVLDLDSMNTINHGGYELEKRVVTRFGGRYGVALSRDDYEQVVANNGIKMNNILDATSTTLLEDTYSDFIGEIPNIVKGFGYDLSLMDVVCLGGTSELLGERITKVIPHAIVKENITWANALGFLKVGQLKYKG